MTTAPGRLVRMLKDVATAFMRADVAHAVAGGMAVAAHGLPRATKDIDFLIDMRDLDRARAALRSLGFGSAGAGGAGFERFVRHPLPDLPEVSEWVDLLCARRDSGRTLLRLAAESPLRWEGSELRVVPVEGLILMKLLAMHDDPSRLQDRMDIIGLLRLHGDRMDMAWLRQAAADLGEHHVEQLESLLQERPQDERHSEWRPGL